MQHELTKQGTGISQLPVRFGGSFSANVVVSQLLSGGVILKWGRETKVTSPHPFLPPVVLARLDGSATCQSIDEQFSCLSAKDSVEGTACHWCCGEDCVSGSKCAAFSALSSGTQRSKSGTGHDSCDYRLFDYAELRVDTNLLDEASQNLHTVQEKIRCSFYNPVVRTLFSGFAKLGETLSQLVVRNSAGTYNNYLNEACRSEFGVATRAWLLNEDFLDRRRVEGMPDKHGFLFAGSKVNSQVLSGYGSWVIIFACSTETDCVENSAVRAIKGQAGNDIDWSLPGHAVETSSYAEKVFVICVRDQNADSEEYLARVLPHSASYPSMPREDSHCVMTKVCPLNRSWQETCAVGLTEETFDIDKSPELYAPPSSAMIVRSIEARLSRFTKQLGRTKRYTGIRMFPC